MRVVCCPRSSMRRCQRGVVRPASRCSRSSRPTQRARLRIYIGAAPGVGKTYSMLEDAHAFRREGVDVVVGFVETYGRSRDRRAGSRFGNRPQRADRISRRRAGRDGRRGHPSSPPATLRGRRARAHQRAWQQAREALSGRPRTARCRHRRADGGQHPASRDAQRRRRTRDRRARARDRSRHVPRSRRRSRQRRRHRAGTAKPTATGQGVQAGEGRTGTRRISSGKPTCRRCASWRFARWRTKSARRRRHIASARGWSRRSSPSA